MADRIGGDLWTVAPRIDGNPRKGVDKLVATVRRDWERLRAGGKLVVAVADDDRVRRHLQLAPKAGVDAVRQAMVDGLQGHEAGFRLVLLDRNTETLLEAIASRDPALRKLAPSLVGKSHVDRDRLLAKATYDRTPEFRARVLQAMPSAGELVDVLTAVVSPPGEGS